MRRIIFISLTAWLVLLGNTVLADTIYTWTDADGVKRYSNSQPPENAENVQKIQEVQYDDGGADRNRQEYDRMVKDASREADRQLEEQARKKARQAAAKQRQEEAQKAQHIDEERAKLMKEIAAIQNRGYSTTFTKGMKDNLIKEVQEKIDQLEGGSGN